MGGATTVLMFMLTQALMAGVQPGDEIIVTESDHEANIGGWMRLRGARRRRGVDRGFVFSDHADWPGLLAAIRAKAPDAARAAMQDHMDKAHARFSVSWHKVKKSA